MSWTSTWTAFNRSARAVLIALSVIGDSAMIWSVSFMFVSYEYCFGGGGRENSFSLPRARLLRISWRAVKG